MVKNKVIRNNILPFNNILSGAMFFLYFFIFLVPIALNSQNNFNFFGEGMLKGILSSENEIPFWFYKNSSTRLGDYTNGLVYGKFNLNYNWGKDNSLNTGVSLMLRDGVKHNFQRENLFIEYKNPWLKSTIGAQERPIYFHGLSATNGNMIWSLNARPMPGIILEANNPFAISKTFSIDWGIAHYSLNDDRYVEDTRIHYKRIGLVVTLNDNHKILGQLQHFAQWAGVSPDYGDLPSDFEAFFDVFFARSSDDNVPGGETQNSVGNHLGSYLLRYQYTGELGGVSIHHEHPFDDGSGTGLLNFPDGVWGITYSPKNNNIISHFLYEYIDTRSQSGNTTFSGNDNYFNNGIYRSGWTYEGNVIGIPLMVSDSDIDVSPTSLQIIGNRFRAHHVGVTGRLQKIDWVVKSTYSKNYGTYATSLNPKLEQWYNFLSVGYNTNTLGVLSIQFGMDSSNINDLLFGGGLVYHYIF